MKYKTLKKRIDEKLTTKKGDVACRYMRVLVWLANDPQRVYPKKWGHNWASLIDHMPVYEEVLDALGIRYKVGNDAPRGGVEGDYVELTSYGKKQIAEWSKYCIYNNGIRSKL